MEDVLAGPHEGALFELAHSNLLVAFDYDGTLAPLGDEREAAVMRPETRELLGDLARRYPCAVVSGRAQDDLAGKLRGLGIVGIVGNHGQEPWRRTELFEDHVRGWVEVLRAALEGLDGVAIEDKRLSVAVHYRQAADRSRAEALVREAAAALRDVRRVWGKDVLNLIPSAAPNKGDGLEQLRERAGCDRALYLGDDESDEEAFALQSSGRVVGVRVEPLESSRATFFIRDQAAVDELLRRLLDLRPAPAAGTKTALGDVVEVMRLIWAIDQSLRTAGDEGRSSVTLAQVLVLHLVAHLPGIDIPSLAGLMHSDHVTTTGIVDALCARGLLERRAEPSNPRRSSLHPAPGGAVLTSAEAERFEGAVRRALATTHPVKVRQAREVLVGVAGALRHARAR